MKEKATKMWKEVVLVREQKEGAMLMGTQKMDDRENVVVVVVN